jgi:hypothetical protein
MLNKIKDLLVADGYMEITTYPWKQDKCAINVLTQTKDDKSYIVLLKMEENIPSVCQQLKSIAWQLRYRGMNERLIVVGIFNNDEDTQNDSWLQLNSYFMNITIKQTTDDINLKYLLSPVIKPKINNMGDPSEFIDPIEKFNLKANNIKNKEFIELLNKLFKYDEDKIKKEVNKYFESILSEN